jgi:hypothetical protein
MPVHPFDNGEMTVRDEKLAPWPRTEADTKQQIADYLSSCDVPEQFRAEFGHIIDFMNRGESSDGTATRQQVKQLDHRRNQDLRTIAPDLAQILEYD